MFQPDACGVSSPFLSSGGIPVEGGTDEGDPDCSFIATPRSKFPP